MFSARLRQLQAVSAQSLRHLESAVLPSAALPMRCVSSTSTADILTDRKVSGRSMRSFEEYKTKLMSAEDAVNQIPDGSFVYISGNAAAPTAVLDALAKRATRGDSWKIKKGMRIGHVLLLGEDPFRGHEDLFHHHAYFVGPADRKAVNLGTSSYVPVHLHHIPRVLRTGPSIDACVLHVSPPDKHGYMSLGCEIMASRAAMESAKKVIVQVNENMPRVLGDSFIHITEVDHIVESNQPLQTLKVPPPSKEQENIASHIVPLIKDGSTLQLGIGGVPDAVLRIISDSSSYSDLRIHTEMISDGIIPAVESGAVRDDGKITITFAMGSERLYDFLGDNPLIEGRPCNYVNDPYVIAQNDKMVAINSALSVDLTGQVNSDSIGPTIYSGFGGQIDFIRGSCESVGGVPIIALPSTAKNGTESRIVPVLRPGAGVVTTRADVHWIVTEFGAINLAGKTLHERARLLISIAHPNFRAELEYACQHLLHGVPDKWLQQAPFRAPVTDIPALSNL